MKISLTVFQLQGTKSNLSEKGQTERKDLIAKFLGITIFDTLHSLAVENSKETTALLKKFNKRDYVTQVSDIEDKIYVGNDKYKKMVEIRDRLRSNKNELLQEIVDLNSSLEKVDVEEFDIDVLNKSKSEIIQKIENLNINQIEGECEAFILSNNEIETQIKEYERKDLENIKDSVSEWKTELLHIESEIEVLKVEVKNRLDKVKALDSHEYDENCKYCMKNVFVQDALKAKSELDKLKLWYQLNYQREITLTIKFLSILISMMNMLSI